MDCALLFVSCGLPATRKVCWFTSFSFLHGCSKCTTCDAFDSKSDFSGYDSETWEMHTKAIQILQVSMLNDARTATDQQQVEKQYGVRHSELYFDIVKHHVINRVHNLVLSTLMTMWKDSGILAIEYVQQQIDGMKVPTMLDIFLIKLLQTSVVLQLINGYVSILHCV